MEPDYWDLLGAPRLDALSELLHENTKISHSARGFVITAETLKVMTAGFKTYDSADTIPLPPANELSMPLGQAIRMRKSGRAFLGTPLRSQELSDLLFYSYGQSETSTAHRMAPSAGGLFPLELYPVIISVSDVPDGIYHYDVRNHRIERLRLQSDPMLLQQAIFVEGLIQRASAVILISAVFGRSKIKYGERGYRFALLEAGHVAQNLVLTAAALGRGACSIGGFVDDDVNRLIDVDGLDEAVLYMIVIGASAPTQ